MLCSFRLLLSCLFIYFFTYLFKNQIHLNLLNLASLAFLLNSADLLVLDAGGEVVLVFKLFGLATRCLRTMQFVSEKHIKQFVDELNILTGISEIVNSKHIAKRKY